MLMCYLPKEINILPGHYKQKIIVVEWQLIKMELWTRTWDPKDQPKATKCLGHRIREHRIAKDRDKKAAELGQTWHSL